MKRIIAMLAAITFVQVMAAADLIEGSLDSLKTEMRIAISLDCSRCVYCVNNKELALEYFLQRARRDNDWQERSLDYFVENFNDRSADHGLLARPTSEDWPCRYELVVTPLRVFRRGEIQGHVYVLDRRTGARVATISFDVEGDDDDHIAIRDAMKEAGDDVGNMFRDLMRGKKIKIKHQDKRADGES